MITNTILAKALYIQAHLNQPKYVVASDEHIEQETARIGARWDDAAATNSEHCRGLINYWRKEADKFNDLLIELDGTTKVTQEHLDLLKVLEDAPLPKHVK